MKSAFSRVCYGALFCLGISCISSACIAGEALIIGPEKGLLEPGKKPKGENLSIGGSLGKMEAPNPYSGLSVPTIPSGRGLSSKELKRQRNAEDEQNNWIFVQPGELQQKDEESAFGVREKDYSIEGLEKEDKSRDYTFRGVGKQKKPTPELLKQIQAVKQQGKEDAEPTSRSENTSVSAHTANELNVKSLFEPAKSDKGFGNSGPDSFSLKDLFKSPLPTMNDDVQRQHQSEFKNFIQGSSGNPLRGGADPRAFGSSPLDWSRSSLNNNSPVFGTAPVPAQAIKAPAAPVAADPYFGRPTPSQNVPPPSTYQETRTFGSGFADPPRRRF